MEGQIDYTSIDTVTVIEAISKRSNRERKSYEIRLTDKRPFRVNDAGNVERNPDYDDPAARTSGRSPGT